MHALLVGAILGMAAVACTGAWRTWRAWRGSADRRGRIRVYLQVAMQLALGLACMAFGIWFVLFGG